MKKLFTLSMLFLALIVTAQTNCLSTVTWDGTSWSSTPDNTTALVFNADYTSSGNLTGCSVQINSGANVTISAGDMLTVEEAINVDASGSLTVQSDGRILQLQDFTNTGITTVNRNSAPMIRLDYTVWSSPVSSQNLLAFSPNTVTNRFYDFDTATNTYIALDPTINDFVVGKGVFVRAPNNWSSTIHAEYPGSYTGTLHNGDYTVPVQYELNLVGNPYASTLSADLLLTNTNNATLGATTLYFWTHGVPSVGGVYPTNNYASYNALGGVAAASGGAIPDGTIQVGQGFYINSALTGNLEFDNSMRTTTSTTQFFKTSIEKHRLRLNFASSTKSINQILFGYATDASNTFDAKYDAKSFNNTASKIYSHVSGNSFVIQGRSLPFDSNDVIQLGYVAEVADTYTISIENFDGLFSTENVYLKDNDLSIYHDIKASQYTFSSDAGTFESRFEIVYDNTLSAIEFTQTEASIKHYDNALHINNSTEIVRVYDITGKLIVESDASTIATTFQSGMYIAVVGTTTLKFIVQ